MSDNDVTPNDKVSATVEPEIMAWIKAEAEREDRTISAQVRRILRQWAMAQERRARVPDPSPMGGGQVYTAPHDPDVKQQWTWNAGPTAEDEGLR